MLFQVEALRQVDAFLKEHGIPYVVIGGIANAVRGEPRATQDADLKVLVQRMTNSEFRALAEARFKPYRRPWLGRAESVLIIHKAIADRPKDWLDIEKILLRQEGKLDVEYVRSWLTQFADALEKPTLVAQFNRLLKGDRVA